MFLLPLALELTNHVPYSDHMGRPRVTSFYQQYFYLKILAWTAGNVIYGSQNLGPQLVCVPQLNKVIMSSAPRTDVGAPGLTVWGKGRDTDSWIHWKPMSYHAANFMYRLLMAPAPKVVVTTNDAAWWRVSIMTTLGFQCKPSSERMNCNLSPRTGLLVDEAVRLSMEPDKRTVSMDTTNYCNRTIIGCYVCLFPQVTSLRTLSANRRKRHMFNVSSHWLRSFSYHLR